MAIRIRNRKVRYSLIALEIMAFLALSAWIAMHYQAASLVKQPTKQKIARAVRLASANPEYHLKLGRLYQYDISNIDREKALHHLQRAAQLDPHNTSPWLELAAAFQLEGDSLQAEACRRQADRLAPNTPSIQWAIGNFYLLHGSVDDAFRHFRAVLAGTRAYDRILFSTAWKASEDPAKILEKLIPRRLETEMSYLTFLVANQQLDEARPVWQRVVAAPQGLTIQHSSRYIGALIKANRPREAYAVWQDLARNGLIRGSPETASGNLVFNGDFEDEILGMGFDWRIFPAEGATAAIDKMTYHSSRRAAVVYFGGTHNVNFRHVRQFVKVQPRTSYRLQGFVKTENITTDSGPRVEVYDFYDPASLRKQTEKLLGTTTGWESQIMDFTTGPKTELIVVALRRLRSQKFDNQIAGKVWLDDVRLTPLKSP
jgi:hypothetical protein